VIRWAWTCPLSNLERLFQLLGGERLNRLAGSINLCWGASAGSPVHSGLPARAQGKETGTPNGQGRQEVGAGAAASARMTLAGGLTSVCLTRPRLSSVGRIYHLKDFAASL